MRKTVWKQKVVSKANQALFLAKYIVENQNSDGVEQKDNSTN